MSDQRGGRRFAVGAGDGDKGRAGCKMPSLAAEQFDIADYLNARLLRERHHPMRRRMRERHPGRQHQACDFAPVDAVANRRWEFQLHSLS